MSPARRFGCCSVSYWNLKAWSTRLLVMLQRWDCWVPWVELRTYPLSSTRDRGSAHDIPRVELGMTSLELSSEWRMNTRNPWVELRDGNGEGRARVSLSHTHRRKKNSSSSPYPNPTGNKLLSHPHPHRVTGIISYPYSYPFSYYFNINLYKIIKDYGKGNIILSNIQYYKDGCFFDINYFKINYNCLQVRL